MGKSNQRTKWQCSSSRIAKLPQDTTGKFPNIVIVNGNLQNSLKVVETASAASGNPSPLVNCDGEKLVVLAVPILKNDGIRQWEGWHPIYEMDNSKFHGLKPPTRYYGGTISIYFSHMLHGGHYKWAISHGYVKYPLVN